jgi:hypothetical protein
MEGHALAQVEDPDIRVVRADGSQSVASAGSIAPSMSRMISGS